MTLQDDARLDATLAALADPTRRAILARLARGEATVTELAAPLPISMPAVTKHLRVLERAGLLDRGRRAQWRPCRLRPEGLQVAADWLAQYRALWEARLDRLAAYLDGVADPNPTPPPAAAPPPSPQHPRPPSGPRRPRPPRRP